eukprot:gene11400-12587_t
MYNFLDDEAFVSLTTNDEYAVGAIVLGKSLKQTKTKRRLVLLVTKGVSEQKREQLSTVWDELFDVEELNSGDDANLQLIARPELGVTFTKLKIWKLAQFKKCVFLDADTLVIQNIDDLFERDELSAAPDIGWPDCFNSGVFVFVPSQETYTALIQFANEHGSFDGGDQGLLNSYFSDWNTKDISTHLSFLYNMVSSVCYSYAPAYRRYGKDAKIVHFLGSVKPWHHAFDHESSHVHFTTTSSQIDQDYVQMWWELYASSELQEDISTSSLPEDQSSSFSDVNAGSRDTVEAVTELDRKASWEKGLIDYNGSDGFDNIREHLDDVLDESQCLELEH